MDHSDPKRLFNQWSWNIKHDLAIFGQVLEQREQKFKGDIEAAALMTDVGVKLKQLLKEFRKGLGDV